MLDVDETTELLVDIKLESGLLPVLDDSRLLVEDAAAKDEEAAAIARAVDDADELIHSAASDPGGATALRLKL